MKLPDSRPPLSFDRILRHPLAFFGIIAAWVATKVAITPGARPYDLTLLCRWDCRWYEAIARLGYVSPVPPLFQDSENSNVAFFPAYPSIARFFSAITKWSLLTTLPLVSILGALVISWLLTRLLREQSTKTVAIKTAILLAYPAMFYLFVSYSESLYIALLLLGIYWLRDVVSGGKDLPRSIDLLALALLGFNLGLTRLTGFLIPGFLCLSAMIAYFRERTEENRLDLVRTAFFLGFSGLGLGSFYLYCHLKFGAWNLYFQQLKLGWYKEFSPLKALGLYFHPPLEGPFEWSQVFTYPRIVSWAMIVFLTLTLAYVAIREAKIRWAKRTEVLPRIRRFDSALLLAAGTHFVITVCGDVGPWDRWWNGIRYSMPTVFLLVYLFRAEWLPAAFTRPGVGRKVSIAILTVILVFFFYLEMGYLIRFTRQEWVS